MKHDQFEPWEPNTYRTGSTTPPKGHSGLVALLLILVVLLAGLVSILSVLNIRLFSAFYGTQQQQDVPLSLEIGHYPEEYLIPGEEDPVSADENKTIGIVGDRITPVYQKHFRLPEGLFITHVAEDSTADLQGIQEGDVLISIEDTPITDEDSLKAFLGACSPGQQCDALIYRWNTDQQLLITLTVEQPEH